jgi:hypothetical protein
VSRDNLAIASQDRSLQRVPFLQIVNHRSPGSQRRVRNQKFVSSLTKDEKLNVLFSLMLVIFGQGGFNLSHELNMQKQFDAGYALDYYRVSN